MWSLVKHLNICSSGGFKQSFALSKTSYLLCAENIQTSKHLIICKFKESYALIRTSCLVNRSGRSHLIFGETSKHLFICWFWTVICFEQKVWSTCSVVKTSKHLFIWRFWTVRCFEQNIFLALWWKHPNICSSGGFDQSYALSR